MEDYLNKFEYTMNELSDLYGKYIYMTTHRWVIIYE